MKTIKLKHVTGPTVLTRADIPHVERMIAEPARSRILAAIKRDGRVRLEPK